MKENISSRNETFKTKRILEGTVSNAAIIAEFPKCTKIFKHCAGK
jgi:hypothetical protein